MKYFQVLLSVLLILLVFQVVQAIDPDCMYTTGKDRPIVDLELAPNGEDIIVADGNLYIVNCISTNAVGGRAATTIDLSDDGSFIATASESNVCLFTQIGEQVWCNEDFAGGATDISISADNSHIIVGSEERASIYMYTNNGEIAWTQFVGSPIYSIAISSSGSYIVAASTADLFSSYDFMGKQRFRYSNENPILPPISDIAISSDGRYILVGCRQGHGGEIVQFSSWSGDMWKQPVAGFADAVAISGNSSYLATGTKNILENSGSVYYFSYNRSSASRKLLWNHTLGSYITNIAMTSNGSLLAVGTQDNQIMVFNRIGKSILNYTGDDAITAIALSNDSQHLVAGSAKGTLYYFTIENLPEEPEGVLTPIPSIPSTISSPSTSVSIPVSFLTPVAPPLDNKSSTMIPSEGNILFWIIPFGLLGGALLFVVLLQRGER